jgi:hypothetical protein
MKGLLSVTAALEVGAGLGLAFAPAQLALLLLGAELLTPELSSLARIAGAAILSLAVACWLARSDTHSRAAWGIIAAMLLYNIGVVAVLAFARLGLGVGGAMLWPAVGLHTLMAVWCVASLRKRPA